MSENEKTKKKKTTTTTKKQIKHRAIYTRKNKNVRRVLNKTRTFRINGTFRLEIRRGAA